MLSIVIVVISLFLDGILTNYLPILKKKKKKIFYNTIHIRNNI